MNPQSHLRAVVLHYLVQQPLSGYGLMKKIKDTCTFWKPSTGSIYPILQSLNAEKLVTARSEGRRTVYTINAEGKKALDELVQQKRKTIDVLKAKWHLVESVLEQERALPELDALQKLVYAKEKQKTAAVRKELRKTIEAINAL